MIKNIFLLFLLSLTTASHAQDSLNVKEGKFMVGIEVRTDKYCTREFNVKYINRFTSFSLKMTPFRYEELSGNIALVYYNPVYSGSQAYNLGNFTYNIHGICIKPGYIIAHKLRKNSYIGHTLSAVLTYSRHEVMVNYNNAHSITMKKDFIPGFEYECLIGVRLLNNFLLSAAAQIGSRQRNKLIMDDLLKGFGTYSTYTPVQGKSKGDLYVNATFGLSFIF